MNVTHNLCLELIVLTIQIGILVITTLFVCQLYMTSVSNESKISKYTHTYLTTSKVKELKQTLNNIGCV